MDKYYKEIKDKLIDDEIYAKTKDYSKERHKVITYFETGKLLYEAGNEYASFTKSDFKICDQPDSESYDFIPLIAAYSYIFSFVR